MPKLPFWQRHIVSSLYQSILNVFFYLSFQYVLSSLFCILIIFLSVLVFFFCLVLVFISHFNCFSLFSCLNLFQSVFVYFCLFQSALVYFSLFICFCLFGTIHLVSLELEKVFFIQIFNKSKIFYTLSHIPSKRLENTFIHST